MATRTSKSWACLTRSKDRPGAASRLAHWPPPFRAGADKPTIVRYVADQEYSRPAGFRITRGILTDD